MSVVVGTTKGSSVSTIHPALVPVNDGSHMSSHIAVDGPPHPSFAVSVPSVVCKPCTNEPIGAVTGAVSSHLMTAVSILGEVSGSTDSGAVGMPLRHVIVSGAFTTTFALGHASLATFASSTARPGLTSECRSKSRTLIVSKTPSALSVMTMALTAPGHSATGLAVISTINSSSVVPLPTP